VYTSSYFHKTGPEWIKDYTAVFYALNFDYFQMPLARFLLTLPDWTLKYMCRITLLWEHFGGFVLLIPFKNDYWRILGCIGFWGMHLGFGLCLRLGLFFWITMALFFAFIPPLFWEKIFMPWIRSKEKCGVIVYYNNSTFSRNLAFFLKCFMLEDTIFLPINNSNEYLLKEKSYLAPNDAISIPIEHEDSTENDKQCWLLVHRNQAAMKEEYIGWNALILCLQLSPLLKLGAFIAKRFPNRLSLILTNWADLSNIITQNPSIYQKLKSTVHPTRKHYKIQKKKFYQIIYILSQIFLLYLLFLMICWNISNIGFYSWAPSPHASGLVWVLRLDQLWNMFTPAPPRTSWWYWIEGELVNEKKVELFKNGALFTWEYNYDMSDELPDFPTSFKNHRWFKYFENGFNQKDHLRAPFGRYVCREFNSRNPTETQLWKFTIWAISHTVDLTGKKTRTGRQQMSTHQCFSQKPYYFDSV